MTAPCGFARGCVGRSSNARGCAREATEWGGTAPSCGAHSLARCVVPAQAGRGGPARRRGRGAWSLGAGAGARGGTAGGAGRAGGGGWRRWRRAADQSRVLEAAARGRRRREAPTVRPRTSPRPPSHWRPPATPPAAHADARHAARRPSLPSSPPPYVARGDLARPTPPTTRALPPAPSAVALGSARAGRKPARRGARIAARGARARLPRARGHAATARAGSPSALREARSPKPHARAHRCLPLFPDWRPRSCRDVRAGGAREPPLCAPRARARAPGVQARRRARVRCRECGGTRAAGARGMLEGRSAQMDEEGSKEEGWGREEAPGQGRLLFPQVPLCKSRDAGPVCARGARRGSLPRRPVGIIGDRTSQVRFRGA